MRTNRFTFPLLSPSATVAKLLALGVFGSAPVQAIPVATAAKPAASAPAAPVTTTPAPTAPALTEDIRDIRPPFHIPPGGVWLAWTAGGCALAALGYGLWRYRHRLPGPRPKPPYEVALERLEAARGLMQPEHAREFSIAVSEAVRNYVEERFATRAAHRTTGEFLHDCVAQADSPLAGHRPLLGEFLHHCDLAKFARWVLSLPEMAAMLSSASAFVRETGQVAANQSPAHSDRAVAPSPLPGSARPGAPDSNTVELAAAPRPAASTSCTLNAT
jgi:hypothetical protein